MLSSDCLHTLYLFSFFFLSLSLLPRSHILPFCLKVSSLHSLACMQNKSFTKRMHYKLFHEYIINRRMHYIKLQEQKSARELILIPSTKSFLPVRGIMSLRTVAQCHTAENKSNTVISCYYFNTCTPKHAEMHTAFMK